MLAKLVKIISKEQNSDGSFPSWSAPLKNWGGGKFTSTSFFASVVGSIAGKTLKKTKLGITINNKLCHFLLLQKSTNWTWNYWNKNSSELRQFSIPDDLDDTFCAATALTINQQLPPIAQTKLIKLLTFLEQQPGGPYRTWVVPNSFSKKWQDIDIAVNCNIAYFLSFHNIYLKNIENLIDQAVSKKNYYSPYYCTEYPVLYFISRIYKGSQKPEIIKYILSKRKGKTWDNPQNTTLATTTLINLGINLKTIRSAIDYLKNLSNKLVLPYPFCTDPMQNNLKFGAGSKALTAALILETLTKCKSMQKIQVQNFKEQKFCNLATKTIINNLQKIKDPLKTEGKRWINKVFTGDPQNTILFTSYWAGNNKNTKHSRLAALATFYGWVVYLLQDKILDREVGPEIIPITNYFTKELYSVIYQLQQRGLNVKNNFSKLAETMDLANYFEFHNLTLQICKNGFIKLPKIPTKYKDYKLLVDKSIGFSFGPLLLDPSLEKFFNHYLIARQLNDDAHDWEEDLKNNKLNSVNMLLITTWQNAKQNKKLSFKNAITELRPVFWNSVIKVVAEQILLNCTKAELESKKFPKLIQPLKNVANQILSQIELKNSLIYIIEQKKDRRF